MDISERITRAESSGNAIAKNPNSSALGLGQFINGTWLDMIKRNRPELAKDKSDAEILELRKNPDLSKEMTAKYAEENEAGLRRAGLPVTPTSTYLMHFAGPGGGVKLMKADPNTPVEEILSAKAINANPTLRGKTAGWVIDWADRRMAAAAASKPGAASRPSPWNGGGQPIPSLGQTQAVAQAFGATNWLPPPTSPNVLSPDETLPLAGAPRVAPTPFVNGMTRAQQAPDNSLPAPGAAPWPLADRFGAWNAHGGAFGPVSSGASSPSEARSRRQPREGDGARSSLPPVRFPFEALLAPDRDRALDQWASSSPRRDASPPEQDAFTVVPGRSAAGFDPSKPDRVPAGGLLGMIQDYMRSNGY